MPTRITPLNILESSFSFWNENKLPSLPSSFCGVVVFFLSESSLIFTGSAFCCCCGCCCCDCCCEVVVGAVAEALVVGGAVFLPTIIKIYII